MKKTIAFALVIALACQGTGVAQEKSAAKKGKRKEKVTNPALAQIEDKPGLPRVLLIGDSISIGYTLAVREILQDKANVHRIPTNGGPTTNGVKNIDQWLGDSKWDVIHFNWGLHDLKYVGTDGTTLTDPKADGSHPQVPLEDYEKNLRQLVERLKRTGAKLIWCTTTPVPPGSSGRIEGDELKYNEVAARVMSENKVESNDLHAYSKTGSDIQLPANVHYSAEGSKYLAKQVASEIMKRLP
jgi:lysophospholipase L1-like esterase